ncbi:MAG: GvpL/GvpF family gas vesicle protein [Chloroflexi bacterium]|nr:GvpL/GvpF family gas vesicle protein [Chloroflexota bacterium]
MRGTYVYAVTTARRQHSLGRLGLPDGGTRVLVLAVGGLAAVVSEYDGPAFGGLTRPALLQCLSVHQRVVERVMLDRPVLPVKFGTVLHSYDEVCRALARFRPRLADALAGLGDVVEIEVAATWDLRRTFAEVREEPAIRALAVAAAGRPAEDTLPLRVEVGRLVKAELDRRRAAYGQHIVQRLAPLSRAVQPNALLRDEMVANVAFLVERRDVDELFAHVRRLDSELDGKLTLRCIGPLPPYTFATVELARPSPTEIEMARRRLELGDAASEVAVNASYRRLATRCHPDLNAGDAAATERFAALTAAHIELLRFIRGQDAGEEAHAAQRRYDLRPDAVGQTILLTVRGAEAPPRPLREPARERDAATV